MLNKRSVRSTAKKIDTLRSRRHSVIPDGLKANSGALL